MSASTVSTCPPLPPPNGIITNHLMWQEVLARAYECVDHRTHVVPRITECWPNGTLDSSTTSLSIRLAVASHAACHGVALQMVPWNAFRVDPQLQSMHVGASCIGSLRSPEALLCTLTRYMALTRPQSDGNSAVLFSATVNDVGIATQSDGSTLEFVCVHDLFSYDDGGLPRAMEGAHACVLRRTATAATSPVQHPCAGLSLIATDRHAAVCKGDCSVESLVAHGA